MKIALEVTAACRKHRGGIGRYVSSMVNALVRVAPQHEYRRLDRISRWRSCRHRLRVPGTRHSWVQGSYLPRDRETDVLHGLDARVPDWPGPARIATLHDVFSLHLDGVAPDAFKQRKRESYLELAGSCDRLIAVSATTRDRFLEHVQFDPDRIDVVHLGVDPRFRVEATADGAQRLGQLGIQGPYLLYLGELSRRKNLPNMLAAYAQSSARSTHKLVLAGARSFGADDTLEAVERLGIMERVHLAGFVPDGLLPQLYAHADALLFATLYEGFGLPGLEALAAGVPVVGGDVGAAPEILGEHAELVDPNDIDAIRAGLEAALEWDAARRAAARDHARGLTWERCAEGTLAVYERALAARG